MKTLNPDFRSRVKKALDGQHFMNLIGFHLSEIEEGRTEGWLDLQEVHKQQAGFAHGGLVATLADITAGFAAVTLVPADYRVVTGEIKISYLHPGLGQKLSAKGWVLKQGKKMHFCEAEVWSHNHGEEKLIAKATATMVNIPPEDQKH